MNTIKKIFLETLFVLILGLSSAYSQTIKVKKINNEFITQNEIYKTVTDLIDSASVTGLCLAVLNDNKVAYLQTYGFRNKEKNEPFDKNTIIFGASFSKVVFTYIVMQLVQEGVIDLDKPLYKYSNMPKSEYEKYFEPESYEKYKKITPRMCLNHTTGLPNIPAEKLKIYFEPGTRFAYSGIGISVLQNVVEQITKKGLEELAVEKVFKPLGMKRTSYVWQEKFHDNYAVGHDVLEMAIKYDKMTSAIAGGSLQTSISDYAKFVQAIMQKKGLKESIWQEMLSPTIRIKSKHQFPTFSNETTDQYDSIELSYGLGWGLFKCKYGRAFFKEGHGPGWQNYNINFIDQKTSLLIMTNSDNGEKIFKDLLEKIIGDTFTPWEWEDYIPYYMAKPKPIGVYMYDYMLTGSVDDAILKYHQIKKSKQRKNFIFDESQLNNLGYQMMKENKMENAIKLFELNVEEYPNSANTYDSLGEAYMNAGNKELAIKNYEKSLQLNPQNKNAEEMLKKLRNNK